MEAGRDGAVILGWTGDNGDPDNFMGVLLSCASAQPGGANRAFWCNEEFSALLSQAKQTSDVAERTRLYEEAQVIFKDQAPWATLDPVSYTHLDVYKRQHLFRAGDAADQGHQL